MKSNPESKLAVEPNGPDLPESNEGYEGGMNAVDGASLSQLKAGFCKLTPEPEPYVSIFTPEPGFGGFAGRPHGWER